MRRTLVVLLTLTVASTLFGAEPNLRVRDDRGSGRDRHMILSVKRPLTPADRAELATKGVDVQGALSEGRYVARVANASLLADDVRFTGVDSFTSEHKILRSAYRAAANARNWADVAVLFHKDISFADARAAIAAAGGGLLDPLAVGFGPMRRVEARIAPGSLGALAADDRVLAVGAGPALKLKQQNAKAATLSKVTPLLAAPYNLSGQGQTVVVWELSEAQATHPEFEGRMTVNGGEEDPFHSTHVSGTIGAAGIRADAKGMAPKATIHEYNINDSDAGFDDMYKLGAVATNVSLGFPLGWCSACGGTYTVWNDEEEYFGAYAPDYGSPAYDDLIAETGTLIVFAAGNYGDYPFLEAGGLHLHVDPETGDPDESKVFCFSTNLSGTDCDNATCTGGCEIVKHHLITPFDTMSVTGAAKNVLAVGAVHTLGQNPLISGFSSRGPAKDGRIKPEVVARGQAVLSTAPNSGYSNSSGTSMAAPVVTGIVALLGEQWKKTNGTRALPQVLRGLIMAGAQDIGNPGPDYTHGFGVADAKAAADLIIADNATGSHIRTLTVGNATEHEVKITTTATQKLKVLINWPDPSVILLGNDAFTAKALVNDIDVKIIDAGGTTHFPYVLDKARHEDNATRGVNKVDNVELIEIADAPAGVYRVIVNGTKVTDGPQSVVLISNAAGQSVAPPCTDANEPNDTAAAAASIIETLTGAICTQSDVDHLRFSVNRFGAISAAVTAGDTPLRLTMTMSNGQNATVVVPPLGTRTLTLQYGTGNGAAPAIDVTLKIEAVGTIGSNPRYDVAIAHGQLVTAKKRSVR